mgnify:CR=1 FL=1
MQTLSEFHESQFLPLWIQGRQLDAKTEANYRQSIAWWSRLTSDPPLDQITDHTVASFIASLCKQPGRSNTMMLSSVATHCRNVDTVLQMAGPRSRHNRRGQGLIDEPPYFDAPRVDQEPPCGDWTIEEVRAMYSAADVMSVPTIDGVDPVDWWRTLICLAYYTGLRCGALMSVEYSMVDDEWINVPARLSKRRKGKRQYLHPEAIEHIDGIRSERAIILEWPRWATTKRTAYLRFRQLQDTAGINKSRQWAFQSFRKTHLTMLAGLSLEHEQGLAVAQHSAGHSNRAVTLGHYVSGDVQERMVAAAIDMMPSPVPPRVVADREFID